MQEQKITIETTTKFVVSKQEKRRMYLTMALMKFNRLLHPDYNELTALKLLYIDNKARLNATQNLVKDNKNDLIISKINIVHECQHHDLYEILVNEGVDVKKINKE